jgi:hypothetical protein
MLEEKLGHTETSPHGDTGSSGKVGPALVHKSRFGNKEAENSWERAHMQSSKVRLDISPATVAKV